MTGRLLAERLARHLIRRACRHLPGDSGEERYREWTAELPAILHDPGIRFTLGRSARGLRYAIGVYRSAHRLPRAAGIPAQDTRQPAIFPRPDGVIPAMAAVILWITVLGLARAIPPGSPWMPPMSGPSGGSSAVSMPPDARKPSAPVYQSRVAAALAQLVAT